MWELLAPAGSYESIIAAVNAGADAVYVGGRLFGARAYADNPEEEQLIHGLEYCHLHGRKLYLTVNTLLKERELETMLDPYLRPFYENGMDGVIVQDFGVMRFVQEVFPGLPVHASTQMTVTGPEGRRLFTVRCAIPIPGSVCLAACSGAEAATADAAHSLAGSHIGSATRGICRGRTPFEGFERNRKRQKRGMCGLGRHFSSP